jgi:TolB protein
LIAMQRNHPLRGSRNCSSMDQRKTPQTGIKVMRRFVETGSMAIVLVLGLIGTSLTPSPTLAQSLENEQGPLPTLEITPGSAKAFRAAVLRFREVGAPVGEERIASLREEIERALAFSSLVLPLDRDAYLASEESIPLDLKLGFDCESWKQSGAEALLQGELRREGERLRVDLRVWDTARCKELKTGTLRGDRDRLDKLGRLIADETVEALTGKRGVSSTEIAFVSDRSGSREVYVMDSDGRDQRRATNGSRIKSFPDWVPDGRAILYVSYDGDQPGFFLTSRSDDVRPGPILRKFLTGLPKYRGRFDPSGEELAMVASMDGAAEIFRVKRKGNEAKRLTRNPAIDIAPSWSPDGERIVFVSDRSGSPQLYLMDRDGGHLRRLTYTGAYNAAPSWSPDGRWIAYETRVRGQFDIWLIDPTGEINFPIVEHPQSDEAPSWSPDGRKIAFSSRRRGRYEIYVMDWNGENVLRLTERSGQNIHPAWGPRMQ